MTLISPSQVSGLPDLFSQARPFRIARKVNRPANTRLRGINIAPMATDIGGWQAYWNNWNSHWPVWISTQVDNGLSVGANCVRQIGDVAGIGDGTYSRATYISHWKQLVEYCYLKGMMVYVVGGDWSWLPTGWTAGTTGYNYIRDELVALASALNGYPNILGMDIWQEAFFSGNRPAGMTAQDNLDVLAMWAAAIKEVSNIPLTASDSNGSGVSTGAKPPWADFFDCHSYGYDLSTAEINAAIAASGDKEFIIGEFGIAEDAGSSPVQTYLRGFADACNAVTSTQFAGALNWAATDQSGVTNGQYGLFSASFVERAYRTTPYKTLLITPP